VAASAASTVAVLALAGTLAVPLLGRNGASPAQPHPETNSLPWRIGPPGPFVGSVGERPGPASLIFASAGTVVTVGADADTYHQFFAPTALPGRTALLSPEGDRVAYEGKDGIAVVDLRSGITRIYPVEDQRANTYRPQAWAPDGRYLVVLTVVPAADPTTEGITKRLALLDLDHGTTDEFAETTWPFALTGFAVAVSPDGRRIAYQYDRFVAVFDRTSRAKSNFQLPEAGRSVLAGKGAWTPDGRSLAILHRDIERWEQSRWELRLVDPATGAERDPAQRPAMAGIGLLRVLGWNSRTGNPIVAGYHGPGTADGGMLSRGVDETLSIKVEAIGVYELPLVGGPVTLVQPVEGIAAIDVADRVIAGGQTRPGEPPWAPPLLLVIVAAAGAIIGLGLATHTLVGRGTAPSRSPWPSRSP
jgi:hypothetical protein